MSTRFWWNVWLAITQRELIFMLTAWVTVNLYPKVEQLSFMKTSPLSRQKFGTIPDQTDRVLASYRHDD